MENFRATLENAVGVVGAQSISSSIDPAVAAPTATVVFRSKVDADLILTPAKTAEQESGPATFRFHDCLVSVAQANGTALDTGPKDIVHDVETVGSLSLSSVKLPVPAADGADRYLDIVGSGELKSFLVSQRQALPTRLDEVMSSSQQNRGLFGFAGLLCVFAIGIFAKRAFDVIAEHLMPGSGKK